MFGPNFSHLILEPSEALQNYKEMVLTKCQYDNSESSDYAVIGEPRGLFNMDSKRPDGIQLFLTKRVNSSCGISPAWIE